MNFRWQLNIWMGIFRWKGGTGAEEDSQVRGSRNVIRLGKGEGEAVRRLRELSIW